jgi:hypothetical protein
MVSAAFSFEMPQTRQHDYNGRRSNREVEKVKSRSASALTSLSMTMEQQDEFLVQEMVPPLVELKRSRERLLPQRSSPSNDLPARVSSLPS